MSVISNNMLAGSSGAGGDPLYVEDVFSTHMYDGTGATQTITNGIDLTGEGGLVWLKSRTFCSDPSNCLSDTEQGTSKQLFTDSASDGAASGNRITSFTNSGFTLGSNVMVNQSGTDYVGWTFRKAPGFFDVVTWTGNGVNGRAIPHSLGSTPGFFVVKCTSHPNENWNAYHVYTGATKYLTLDTTNQANTSSALWNNTAPTDTAFTVSDGGGVNASNRTYVAYLFAHNDQSFGENGDEAIIKCGEYIGNGSSSNFVADVGFEPQWVMMKRHDGDGQNWHVFDIGRIMSSNEYNPLSPNQSNDEGHGTGYGVQPTANGFEITASGTDINGNNYRYIYVAIRRPHKPPSSATDVFNVQTMPTNSAGVTFITTGFDVDMLLDLQVAGANNSTDYTDIHTRLRGNNLRMRTSSAADETASTVEFDHSGGYKQHQTNDVNAFAAFRRAPKFMEMGYYMANNNVAFDVPHQLGVAPELVMIKDTADVGSFFWDWTIGSDYLTDWTKGIRLNNNQPENTFGSYWNGAPTATHVKLGTSSDVNSGSERYLMWLFATLPGISKVGGYTGTGTTHTIDCGFTNGPRFVLIKRVDSTGHWYTFNTAHGLGSGTDPYKGLDSPSVAATNVDWIDPTSSGFTLTTNAPGELNGSGDKFLFLAIA